jgi:hypothetical protein
MQNSSRRTTPTVVSGETMSFVAKALPFAVFAALLTACSDVSAPNQTLSAPQSSLAKKSGSTDGRGNSDPVEETVSPLVVTTAPKVNVTGTWIANTDGPDVPHKYTYTLTQSAEGLVSGVAIGEGVGTSFALVVGTVNGTELKLYAGAGTVCTGCQLILYYQGTVSSNGSRFEGAFKTHGERVIFFKQ